MTSSFALARTMQSSAFSDPRASGRVQYGEGADVGAILAHKCLHDVHPRAGLSGDVFPDVTTDDFLSMGRLTAGTRRPVNRGLSAPDWDAFRAFLARHGLGLANAA